jgi:Gas vesicle protein
VRRREEQGMEILEGADQSLLEVIDHVLNKGVVVSGEVMLGVAGVDLVYLRLSALLCASDRVQPRARKK